LTGRGKDREQGIGSRKLLLSINFNENMSFCSSRANKPLGKLPTPPTIHLIPGLNPL
jgi:hypothetical protein